MKLRDLIFGVFVGNLLTAMVVWGIFAIFVHNNQATVKTVEQSEAELRKNGEDLNRRLRELNVE